MSFSKTKLIIIMVALFFIIALAIGLPFFSKPSNDLIPKFALSQLAFSAVAFFIIFTGLILNLVQFSKSMAKPKLSLAFSEDGKTETIIKITDRPNQQPIELKLWVFNSGNVIAKTFQIDLEIPTEYRPRLSKTATTYTQVDTSPKNRGGKIIKSIYQEKFIAFVHRPALIDTLQLQISPNNYAQYRDFDIEYNIFGDWADVQEGNLKIIVKKGKEVF